jgi:hypothetical protein
MKKKINHLKKMTDTSTVLIVATDTTIITTSHSSLTSGTARLDAMILVLAVRSKNIRSAAVRESRSLFQGAAWWQA